VDEALRSSAVGRKAEAPKGLECGEEVGSEEGAVPPLHKFFLLSALTVANLGAFWVVFLQLSCLFTAYANIMQDCHRF